MKKIVLSICAAAIIGLAVINLNLALNSESNANLTLASIISLAKGEDPSGKGCTPGSSVDDNYGCSIYYYWWCSSGGSESDCEAGIMHDYCGTIRWILECTPQNCN